MALQRIINTPARGIGKTTLETLERLALETGQSTWDAVAAAITNRLIPSRALAALESFRQLILDAQAMMDPDFAGKLSADVAESANADTGFGFGAAAADSEISASDDQPDEVQDQMPLLNADHFSPDPGITPEISDGQEVSGHDGPGPPATGLRRWGGFSRAEPAGQMFGALAPEAKPSEPGRQVNSGENSGFRSPGDSATLPELIRFIIDRTGYIKALETEGTPEAFSRIENLKELANAAHDAEERGETLADFLDHAALASDTDKFDPNARVTLMTLHAAKGLEFPLVFLAGLEEGLFPHSRTLSSPEELEEERRLCYVGMTRAMNTLVLTRAHYRRRYGADVPEASVPSRFLEEVPSHLIEISAAEIRPGRRRRTPPRIARIAATGSASASRESHFNYEDESQETLMRSPLAISRLGKALLQNVKARERRRTASTTSPAFSAGNPASGPAPSPAPPWRFQRPTAHPASEKASA